MSNSYCLNPKKLYETLLSLKRKLSNSLFYFAFVQPNWIYNYIFENWNIKVNTKIILRSLNYFNHSFKPKGGQDVRTRISTTHHTHTVWPKIFDTGQKLTVEFRPKLSFWDFGQNKNEPVNSCWFLLIAVKFLVSSPQTFKCYKINAEQRLAPIPVLICSR